MQGMDAMGGGTVGANKSSIMPIISLTKLCQKRGVGRGDIRLSEVIKR